jgi:xanthine dehydrogenase accessory factor
VSTAGRSDSFQPITALQWIFGELSTAPKQIEESAVRELLDDLDRWRTQGKRVAIARVVDIEGSGPREPGAAMAVSEDGVVAGSVSGGCVEGAVVEAALESLRTGERRVHTFGFSDTDAFAVGLTCGGIIHLFVEPLDW